MSDSVTKIGKGGRVVIPSRHRKALGIEEGQQVIVSLDRDGIWIRTPEQAVAHAQSLVREHVGKGKSLVDELLRERRREALGDDASDVPRPRSDNSRRR